MKRTRRLRRRWFELAVLACALGGALASCGTGSAPYSPGSGGDAGGNGGPDAGNGADAPSFGDGWTTDAGMIDCTNPNSPDMTGCQCHAGDMRACYDGPPGTRHAGACKDGSQTCVQSGEFGKYGSCMGEADPTPEMGHCTDSVDNDCSGLTDCQDPACAKDPACQSPPDASDGPAPPPDDAGCTPPLVSITGQERCPNGTIDPNAIGLCCPCTINDCPMGAFGNFACCTAPVCANSSGCSSCPTSTLDPECNGMIDQDCDDFPEDCDQLCCPCKPGTCRRCPQGQVECPSADSDSSAGTSCTNVATSDTTCGACDSSCSAGQHCMNGLCM